MTTVDDLIARARARYERLSPNQALAEANYGAALLVDVRPRELREANGDVPGAFPVGLNVLEWRADPTSEWRLDAITDHDVRVILVCQEGYSSSLAVARLLDLGLSRATDVTGGHDAWVAAGLPVVGFDPDAGPERAVDPQR